MQKIKQFVESEKGKDILVVLIVILVGLGSFELGRLSKASSSSGIKVQYGDQPLGQEASAITALDPANNFLGNNSNSENSTATTNTSGKNFFASNRGSKYYTAGCSAGKSLKLANRVYFATSAEAEKAGYTLSSSCR